MIPTRADLAERFSNPLIKLLILDWRFSCLLFLVVSVLGACVLVPLRFFRTTPAGVIPVVRINLLELIESKSFASNARKAQAKGDSETAMTCWSRAIACNPGDVSMIRGYIQTCLGSSNPAHWMTSFQAASWLTNIAPKSVPDLLLWTKVADKNEAWELIDATISSRPEMQGPDLRLYWLRSRFFARRFQSASELLKIMPLEEQKAAKAYVLALQGILGNDGEQDGAIRSLQSSLVADQNAIPAYEAFLVAASTLKKIEPYGQALKSLRGLATNTFPFEIEYAHLLFDSGRKKEAVNIASTLSNPRTVVELLKSVGLMMDLGMVSQATRLLQTESGKFDNLQPTILYATLLLEQDHMDELAKLRSQLAQRRSASDNATFILALEAAAQPQPGRLQRLESDLTQAKSEPSPLLVDFAQAVLLKGKQPKSACTVLLRHPRTNDLAYARELFAAAERARDSDLMRSAAENWYRLSPGNLNAVQNYCAMLAMFDEKPELSLKLATQCLESAPRSIAGKIDHIAALINNGKFKIADAMMSALDESALSSYERSHFNFLKLKSALSSGQNIDSEVFAQNISVSDLYPEQIKWLDNHGVKLLLKNSE